MQMWSMHNRTTEEQARRNRDRRNGKSVRVEATTTTNDANDVGISVESSGVVHATSRSNQRTGGASECSHGGHDRCICGLAKSRKGIV